MASHDTEATLQMTVGASPFKGRWRTVSVWSSDGEAQPTQISPAKKRPLTFQIPLPVETIVVADHHLRTKPALERGLSFPVIHIKNRGIQVGDVEVWDGLTHVVPKGIAGR